MWYSSISSEIPASFVARPFPTRTTGTATRRSSDVRRWLGQCSGVAGTLRVPPAPSHCLTHSPAHHAARSRQRIADKAVRFVHSSRVLSPQGLREQRGAIRTRGTVAPIVRGSSSRTRECQRHRRATICLSPEHWRPRKVIPGARASPRISAPLHRLHFLALHCTNLEESSFLPLAVPGPGQGFASHARGGRQQKCACDRQERPSHPNPTRVGCHDRCCAHVFLPPLWGRCRRTGRRGAWPRGRPRTQSSADLPSSGVSGVRSKRGFRHEPSSRVTLGFKRRDKNELVAADAERPLPLVL